MLGQYIKADPLDPFNTVSNNHHFTMHIMALEDVSLNERKLCLPCHLPAVLGDVTDTNCFRFVGPRPHC
jgi:hypothetical protein